MKPLDQLCAELSAHYYPPPRPGVLKLSIVGHPELEQYFQLGASCSLCAHAPTGYDAELTLSLGLLDYLLANVTSFDPRDAPYVKAMRASGDMSLVHHFTQLLKRPSPEVQALVAALKQQSYATCRQIEEITQLDPHQMLQAMAHSRPLCLRGVFQSSLIGLNQAQFVEQYGQLALRHNAVSGELETVADIAAQLADDSRERVYLNGIEVPSALAPHLHFPGFADSAFSVGLLWWGKKQSTGVITKLHCDFQVSFLAQLWGEKKLQLFAPDQAEALYAAPTFNRYQLCQVDPGAPDLARYPRFAQAQALEVTIGPGDMLLIPSGWYHCVWALSDVLSVNRFMQQATLRALQREIHAR